MNRLCLLACLLLATNPIQAEDAPDAAELTRLLNDFLAGASRSDAAVHDRFWADDLIYTRSAGKRVNKVEIMANLKPEPGEPETTYSADDIRIQQYGTTAIVAFRLVGKTHENGETQTANFLNTGTFLKRNGKWQAVAWQATKVPRTEEESKKEVAAAATMFFAALAAGDSKKLEAVTDKTFVLTDSAGNQVGRANVITAVKHSKPGMTNETVAIYRDAAIVRTKAITLTFSNMDGEWKAIAMQMAVKTD